MKLIKGVMAAILALLPLEAMAEDTVKIGLFNRDAAINLIRGQYDLILNNADNVIAWAEGQGEDPQKNDFVIFLGGSQGVDQKLIVAPGITGYPDLKGKVFAVDAPTTGYAIVGVYILKKHGLDRQTLVIFTSDNGPWLSYGDHAGSAQPRR